MYWGIDNGDVSGEHCLMNSQNLFESMKKNYIDSTKKRAVNVPNVSEIKDNGLHDGVDIDVMLPASTLHQYVNMECNNDSHCALMNGIF